MHSSDPYLFTVILLRCALAKCILSQTVFSFGRYSQLTSVLTENDDVVVAELLLFLHFHLSIVQKEYRVANNS